MKNSHQEPFLHTWTKKKFYFLNPRAEDICIEDIAHSLSLQCRFNGHIAKHYSVAEHSILVAKAVEAQGESTLVVLAALLHDAGEAYLGDVVSPLKALLPEYKKYEKSADKCIAEKFGLPNPFPAIICKMDKIVLKDEFSFLEPFVTGAAVRELFTPIEAENAYLETYRILTEELANE